MSMDLPKGIPAAYHKTPSKEAARLLMLNVHQSRNPHIGTESLLCYQESCFQQCDAHHLNGRPTLTHNGSTLYQGGQTLSHALNQQVVLHTFSVVRFWLVPSVKSHASVSVFVDFCIVLDSVNGIVWVYLKLRPFVLPGNEEIG